MFRLTTHRITTLILIAAATAGCSKEEDSGGTGDESGSGTDTAGAADETAGDTLGETTSASSSGSAGTFTSGDDSGGDSGADSQGSAGDSGGDGPPDPDPESAWGPCNACVSPNQPAGVTMGGGCYCAPPCASPGGTDCPPADSGSAMGVCGAQSPQGGYYCVLVCQGSGQGNCPDGMTCEPIPGQPAGACTWGGPGGGDETGTGDGGETTTGDGGDTGTGTTG